MAHQSIPLTADTPTDLADAASLIDDATYVAQNHGPTPVFIAARADADGAPDASSQAATVLRPLEAVTVTPTAGETIWAWGAGPLSIVEAD